MLPVPAFVLLSQAVEPHEVVEVQIQAAVAFIRNGQNRYPNIAEVARNNEVSD